MSSYSFKGYNSNYGENQLRELVSNNMIEFFNWGFIDIGAYTNVELSSSGAYGGQFSQLRKADDPRYTTGTVWEAIRGNWVWESGVSVGSPIRISGVYVNNVLLTSGYNIDYINGRVFFDTPKSGTVKVAYSYKEIQFLHAREHPLIYLLQNRSRRPDDSNWLVSSGLYTRLSDQKINMPCVAVECVSRNSSPYQLGGGQKVYLDLVYYILGEDDTSVSKISDIICNQKEKTIFAFDTDLIKNSGSFPLNYNGFLSANPKIYPQLADLNVNGGYRTNILDQGKIYIENTQSYNGQWISTDLYYNTVNMKVELIVPRI